MNKVVKTQEELLISMKKMGDRQLFMIREKNENNCYFAINNEYIKKHNLETDVRICVRDLHEENMDITALVFAINYDSRVHIAFIDLKNRDNMDALKKIISEQEIKLRVINEKEDYNIYFKNPAIQEFKDNIKKINSIVEKENYTTENFTNFINCIGDKYSNDEMWKIWTKNNE